MDESKVKDPIPEEFESIEAAAQFWDTHSLADYWDQTHEVEIEVAARRRRRVVIDPTVWEQVVVCARARGVLPETLINLWLAERAQNVT
ncbi:MAG: CopG family antitoxin [Anaerolineae bacterium]|nr:CopG family antitoxin [Anaerolineae bacterium]